MEENVDEFEAVSGGVGGAFMAYCGGNGVAIGAGGIETGVSYGVDFVCDGEHVQCPFAF